MKVANTVVGVCFLLWGSIFSTQNAFAVTVDGVVRELSTCKDIPGLLTTIADQQRRGPVDHVEEGALKYLRDGFDPRALGLKHTQIASLFQAITAQAVLETRVEVAKVLMSKVTTKAQALNLFRVLFDTMPSGIRFRNEVLPVLIAFARQPMSTDLIAVNGKPEAKVSTAETMDNAILRLLYTYKTLEFENDDVNKDNKLMLISETLLRLDATGAEAAEVSALLSIIVKQWRNGPRPDHPSVAAYIQKAEKGIASLSGGQAACTRGTLELKLVQAFSL